MFISILSALLVLVAIAVFAAVILYFVAQKFKVIENPLIDEVAEALPGANCGGCGFAGCRGLADAMVKAGNLDGLFCPAGGNATAGKVAAILGLVAQETEAKIAVVRCAGSPDNSPAKIKYSGLHNCRFANDVMTGEGGCSYSCLGFGNCVTACTFDAIHINPETKLPVVDEGKCVACGACVKTCPRTIIELRDKGVKNKRVFVSCMNEEKGGEAKKNCTTACIACCKCQKVCPFEAITIENQLAYINFAKCKLCRKCVTECPTGAIWEVNFVPRKVVMETAPEEENQSTYQV